MAPHLHYCSKRELVSGSGMSCGAWLVRAVSINLAAVPPVPWLTQQSVTKHLMIKKNPEPKDKSYTVFQACLCCKIRLVNLKSTFAKSATSQQFSLCPGLELKLSGFPFEPEKTKFSGKHVMAWLLTHGFYCLLVALIIHVGFWFGFFFQTDSNDTDRDAQHRTPAME